jgi:hypothetical protein
MAASSSTLSLTATLPANGALGSLLTAEVTDWYWLTLGFINDIDYNGGLNFSMITEAFEGAWYIGLWYYQNNQQTASPPAIVTHQGSADLAGQSLVVKEWIGAATSGTAYEAQATQRTDSTTTASVTTGTMTSGQRLVIDTLGTGAGSAFVGDTDYTMRWIQTVQPLISQDREMAGGGTDTATVTWTGSTNGIHVIAAFLPQSADSFPAGMISSSRNWIRRR